MLTGDYCRVLIRFGVGAVRIGSDIFSGFDTCSIIFFYDLCLFYYSVILWVLIDSGKFVECIFCFIYIKNFMIFFYFTNSKIGNIFLYIHNLNSYYNINNALFHNIILIVWIVYTYTYNINNNMNNINVSIYKNSYIQNYNGHLYLN